MTTFNTWVFLLTIMALGFSTPALSRSQTNHLLLISSEKGEPYQSDSNAMFSRLNELGYSNGNNLSLWAWDIMM